jgi:hypothetical protein
MSTPITGAKESFFCVFLTIHKALLCVYNQKALALVPFKINHPPSIPVKKDVYNLSMECYLTGKEKVTLFQTFNPWM